MRISNTAWNKYIRVLSKLDADASADMVRYLQGLKEKGITGSVATPMIIEHAYALATKYGEGAAAASCEMYDAIAILSDASVPPAEPAATATYGETAKTINGARLFSLKDEVTGSAVGRLVKQAGVDTTMQNALRDGAEWAWIPSGDTCAFCLTLASRGWQKASKNAIKNGHAEHIHNNCDCTYAIRFNSGTEVAGYDPEKYADMYYDAEGNTPKERINYMRRQFYQENKDEINAQKRDAYAKRIELNSSAAEEYDVNK